MGENYRNINGCKTFAASIAQTLVAKQVKFQILSYKLGLGKSLTGLGLKKYKKPWAWACPKMFSTPEFITIFYQFLHIRIEIIYGSHMYIFFLPRVSLYVSFLPLANARGKTSWHKGLPVVKTIYTYGFQELFLKCNLSWKKLPSAVILQGNTTLP